MDGHSVTRRVVLMPDPNDAVESSSLQPNKVESPPIPEAREFVKELNPELPDVFKRSALLTAGYIEALDADPELAMQYPPVKRFVEQLSQSAFITRIHMRAAMPMFAGSTSDPRICLPSWLQRPDFAMESPEKRAIREERDREIAVLYDEMMSGKGFEDHPNGRYFSLGRRNTEVPTSRMFKGYVEGDELLRALKDRSIQQLIGELQRAGYLSESKLFDNDRMVFYFGEDIDRAEEILQYFKIAGIKMRGPAQDVLSVKVDDQGGLELDSFRSNDGALGEGGGTLKSEYTVQRYSQRAFLQNYLQMCLFVGKKPSLPYQTAFVYLVDPNEVYAGNEAQAIEQASQLVGYPVVYTPNRIRNDLALFR
jgi:hypothetical protein